MAELSQFLNSGKVLKVVSAFEDAFTYGVTNSVGDTLYSITPSGDQTIAIGLALTDVGWATTTIGIQLLFAGNVITESSGGIPLPIFPSKDSPFLAGKGDTVSIKVNKTTTDNTPRTDKVYIYILEEA